MQAINVWQIVTGIERIMIFLGRGWLLLRSWVNDRPSQSRLETAPTTKIDYVSTISFKAVASYAIPLVTIYIGGGVDITRLTLDDDLPLFPDLRGKSFNENGFSAAAGLSVTPFPLVRVNADYTMGEFNTVNIGVGISIR